MNISLGNMTWQPSYNRDKGRQNMLIDRGRVDKVMQNNTNVLVDDIKSLKTMFNGVTKLGFPF